MEHKPFVSTIGWDMNLLAAAYAVIHFLSIWPVFVTAFNPLMMIIVAIMGAFILAEKIYLGGVIGAILIVMGLYSVLWGKHKENKEKEAEITIEVLKCCLENGMTLETMVKDVETNNDIDMHKGEASRELRVAIVVPKV
ncbi:WAT1-related protein [Glycine soja]|uniref:Auxin-induced protein 5NG4 n=1 Tax=Glycine soja TaxID=3848 RepID=A0A0B2RCL8_GLYSO|nr:Auxin-induced protein 5NG4 [Glycine soja]RZB41314.1 WAT1-related protein [Glycine soja]